MSCAFNVFHILVYQVEYKKILLMKYHLYKWNVVVYLRILKKTKFSEALMKTRVLQGQNEHNRENQRESLDR